MERVGIMTLMGDLEVAIADVEEEMAECRHLITVNDNDRMMAEKLYNHETRRFNTLEDKLMKYNRMMSALDNVYTMDYYVAGESVTVPKSKDEGVLRMILTKKEFEMVKESRFNEYIGDI